MNMKRLAKQLLQKERKTHQKISSKRSEPLLESKLKLLKQKLNFLLEKQKKESKITKRKGSARVT